MRNGICIPSSLGSNWDAVSSLTQMVCKFFLATGILPSRISTGLLPRNKPTYCRHTLEVPAHAFTNKTLLCSILNYFQDRAWWDALHGACSLRDWMWTAPECWSFQSCDLNAASCCAFRTFCACKLLQRCLPARTPWSSPVSCSTCSKALADRVLSCGFGCMSQPTGNYLALPLCIKSQCFGTLKPFRVKLLPLKWSCQADRVSAYATFKLVSQQRLAKDIWSNNMGNTNFLTCSEFIKCNTILTLSLLIVPLPSASDAWIFSQCVAASACT